MKPVLLIDFGSTYTKVTAVDVGQEVLLGTASSYTTVQTDIGEGLQKALTILEQKTGKLDFAERYACSSAAGGLRMITSGLVPELTAEAARQASLGAGAKVIRVYSYELTKKDIAEITASRPDMILLVGGTDGGNSKCILSNAKKLSQTEPFCPVVIAGNRNCADECEELLENWETHVCENVMPKFNELNIEPAQQEIRQIFLNRIIQAKGLSKASELISGILMPTPAAMMAAMQLLAEGTESESGIGELAAIDLGGATTDVYSIADGRPVQANTIVKGLMEPYAKRTVEGDIGMRYSIWGIVEAAGIARVSSLSGIDVDRAEEMIRFLSENTEQLPNDEEWERLDFALASLAVETAMTRHAGTLEPVYTPMGLAYSQAGKDLTGVRNIVITGGAIIHTKRTGEIAAHSLQDPNYPGSLRPARAEFLVDRNYILAAMGLLGQYYPDTALKIMKKELVRATR